MFPSSGNAAVEVRRTPSPATAKVVSDAAEKQGQFEDGEIEDGEIFEGTVEFDSSPHPASPAGSSAVARQSADYFSFCSAPDADSSAIARQSADYFTSHSAPSADSAAAANEAADDQTQEALDSQLGTYGISNMENVLEEDLGGLQTVQRRDRGHGRGGRGHSRGRGHFQGQGNRGGTKYPVVAKYSQESLQKAKARLEVLQQEKRKRARSVSGEMSIAKRSSAQPTEGAINLRDSATPASLDFTQVIRPPRLIRAAVKVGNSGVIGNAFTTTKNYSVKVTFDGGRNGQASISLRFRINKSSHVEERDVSLNENDVWNFFLVFKISTAGRRDPAIQEFELFFVNKAFPKSATEEALIKECGEGELNRFTSINLEVLRVYKDRGEPPSMQDLAKSITDTDLLQTLQVLLAELQAPLKLQIWFLWKERKVAEDILFKYMRNLFETKMT